jgi:hypothetical protein
MCILQPKPSKRQRDEEREREREREASSASSFTSRDIAYTFRVEGKQGAV